MKSENFVTIIWGIDAESIEIVSFNSVAEKNAFLKGVEAGCGWSMYVIRGGKLSRNS